MAFDFTKTKNAFSEREQWLRSEYAQLHTGRATPALLDGVYVLVYGNKQSLKHVASISVEDPKTLRVVPWDKEHIKEIEHSIQAENLGVTVGADDQGVRVSLPAFTTENREKLAKILKEKLEEARIAVRKSREEALTQIKHADLSEDDDFRTRDDLQKIVVGVNANLEKIFSQKQEEVMTA